MGFKGLETDFDRKCREEKKKQEEEEAARLEKERVEKEQKLKAEKEAKKKAEEAKEATNPKKTKKKGAAAVDNKETSVNGKQQPADEEEKKDGEKQTEGEEEKKEKEEEKKGPVISDLSQLENYWQATGQAPKAENVIIKYADPKDFKVISSFRNLVIDLKLTDELTFNMSRFDKVNKGLRNNSINCYMNVCLQSLLSCPAFFNMCACVSNNEIKFSPKEYPILNKFAELTRFFDPNVLSQAAEDAPPEINKYNKTRIVDA